MFGVFFVVFADHVDDLVVFFLGVDLLECDAVFPGFGLGVYLVYLEVGLDAKFSEFCYDLVFLLFHFWGDGHGVCLVVCGCWLYLGYFFFL